MRLRSTVRPKRACSSERPEWRNAAEDSDLLLRRHDAARRRRRAARLPRRAGRRPARQLCRAELDRFRGACRRRRAAHRRPAPRKRRCSPRWPRSRAHGADRFVNIRETAGWSTEAPRPGRRWRRCSRPPPSRCRTFPLVSLSSEGVILIYGRDERAIEAGKLLTDHLDVTVLISRPTDRRAAARHRVSRGEGHDPHRQGPSRRVRARRSTITPRRRRPRAARSPSARRATARCRAATSCSICPAARRCFPPHDLRDGYLRADPGDPGRGAAARC